MRFMHASSGLVSFRRTRMLCPSVAAYMIGSRALSSVPMICKFPWWPGTPIQWNLWPYEPCLTPLIRNLQLLIAQNWRFNDRVWCGIVGGVRVYALSSALGNGTKEKKKEGGVKSSWLCALYLPTNSFQHFLCSVRVFQSPCVRLPRFRAVPIAGIVLPHFTHLFDRGFEGELSSSKKLGLVNSGVFMWGLRGLVFFFSFFCNPT